jgi:hypothetical protein
MQQETIQTIANAQTVADLATKTQYTASFLSVALSFVNQNAAALGLLVALCGFLISWYYRHKTFKLEKAKYAKDGIVEAE